MGAPAVSGALVGTAEGAAAEVGETAGGTVVGGTAVAAGRGPSNDIPQANIARITATPAMDKTGFGCFIICSLINKYRVSMDEMYSGKS